MIRSLFKRSLPIAVTVSALAFGYPIVAQSASSHSSDSYPYGTYDTHGSSTLTSDQHNRRYNNERDYYTDQYGDLDTVNQKKDRRHKKTHSQDGIYAGTTRLYQEEMRQLDRELRQDIRDELAFSPFVDEERVHVKVRRGVATLTGTVEDRSAMVAAVENAYEGGARRVVNKLRVNRYDERPWSEYSDSRLEAEIYDELEEGISVDVRNGVATLRGTVDDRTAMADAVEDTYDIGARRVVNKLRLRN